MQELVTTISALALSEASCETLGSMMEAFHGRQYFTSAGNEDLSCQRALFNKYSGTPVARSDGFIQELHQRVVVSIYYFYFF